MTEILGLLVGVVAPLMALLWWTCHEFDVAQRPGLEDGLDGRHLSRRQLREGTGDADNSASVDSRQRQTSRPVLSALKLGFAQVGASLLAYAALALFDRLPDDEFRFNDIASAGPLLLPGTIYLAITIAKTK